MSLVQKETQKSIRIVLPKALYEEVKRNCEEHGDISKLVSSLLRKYLGSIDPDRSDD